MLREKQTQEPREDKSFNADINDGLIKGKNLVRKIRGTNRSPSQPRDDTKVMSATFSVPEGSPKLPPKTGRLKNRPGGYSPWDGGQAKRATPSFDGYNVSSA